VQVRSSFEGLGIVNFFTLSHYGWAATEAQNRYIVETYGEKYRIVPITDEQAVMVDASGDHVVSSPADLASRKHPSEELSS
jgi:peptidase E